MMKSVIFGASLLFVSMNAFSQDSVFQIGTESGASQGQELNIPVDMVENNHSITQFQVDVVYDAGNLTLRAGGDADNSGLTGCDFVDKGPANPDKTISCSEPDGAGAGRLRVIVDDSGADAGDVNEDTVFFIRIDADSDATFQTYSLTSENEDAFDGGTQVTAIQWNDGEITVVDQTAVLNVQPPSHDFGGIESGNSSAPFEVTISNDGSDGVDMQVSGVSLDDNTNFNLDMNGGGDPCGPTNFTLMDGESCTVAVTFTPESEAMFSATLSVTSDAGQTTNDTVAFDGEGTPGPAGSVSIDPNPFDFGQLLTNDETATQTFTVNSDGAAGSQVTFDPAAIAGDTAQFSIAADNCNGQTVPAGDSCTVEIEYAPIADGMHSIDLTVGGSDGNSDPREDMATVSGEGISESRFVSSPPAGSVSLGTAPPGGSLDQTVTVSNEGNQNLTVNNCTLTDPDGLFSTTPAAGSISFDIVPDGSDSFDVSCNVPETGQFSASLTCDTNDPDNQTVTYDFSCNGQPLVVPTMQPWGLVVLTLLMLMVGGLSIRYFRV